MPRDHFLVLLSGFHSYQGNVAGMHSVNVQENPSAKVRLARQNAGALGECLLGHPLLDPLVTEFHVAMEPH